MSNADSIMQELLKAADAHADKYVSDDRQDIKTDVLNAFYAGANWHAKAQRIAELEKDAARYRYLAERYTGWDAEWGRDEANDEPGKAVLVFNADTTMRAPFRKADLAEAIDAARNAG